LEIKLADRIVGEIGLVPPSILTKIVDSGHVVWFSMKTEDLEGEVYPAVDCRPMPVYPGSWQDFTFVWPLDKGHGELARLLDKFTHTLLEQRNFLDFYRPKKSETGNYTFRFSIRQNDRTLTADDIKDFRDAILSFISANGLNLV